ncbi:MAG: 50S ribosomal protein L22 [bacterium]|nr:50S ribosomal protein L22 [bacterium]
MEVMARAKYVRHSPRKVREIVKPLIGREVNEALSIIRSISRRASKSLEKVVKSAISNGKQKSPESEWKIKNIRVEEGPALKRFRAATMGRAVMIKRRTSHITVVLEEIQRRDK